MDTLVSHGLLERRSGVLAALPHQLMRVAELLGVLEDVAAQLRRYADQRTQWHAWLARHKPDHAAEDLSEDYWWPPDEEATWTLLDTVAA